MSDDVQASSRSANSRSFLEHVLVMPGHHKALLTLAILLFGGGLPGQALNYFSSHSNSETTSQIPSPAGTGDAKYMVSDSATQPSNQLDADDSLYRRMSPAMFRVGLAFIAGFVLGWTFRAFLKIMALLTTAGVAILVGLSYFHVLNIDFTAVEKKYQSDMAWVSDQTERAAKTLLSHIPGSASSFAGMFIGFRRK